MIVNARTLCFIGLVAGVAGCSQKVEQTAPPAAAAAAPAKPTLGIKPFGSTTDPNFKPDYSQLPPELAKTFTYIDEHIDEHVENLRKWIQQPSISNSGEGIPESAEMVKGFFEQLGCQDSRVVDTGITEYRQPGEPGRVCEVRRGRAQDARDPAAGRHDAGDAARQLDRAAVRGAYRRWSNGRRADRVARDHRPRRQQLQGR